MSRSSALSISGRPTAMAAPISTLSGVYNSATAAAPCAFQASSQLLAKTEATSIALCCIRFRSACDSLAFRRPDREGLLRPGSLGYGMKTVLDSIAHRGRGTGDVSHSTDGKELMMPRHGRFVPQGVIPAVLLPFDDALAIDEASFRTHLRAVAATPGLAAVTVNAHSTEVASCGFEEQRRVLDIAGDTIGDRLPLVNG